MDGPAAIIHRQRPVGTGDDGPDEPSTRCVQATNDAAPTPAAAGPRPSPHAKCRTRVWGHVVDGGSVSGGNTSISPEKLRPEAAEDRPEAARPTDSGFHTSRLAMADITLPALGRGRPGETGSSAGWSGYAGAGREAGCAGARLRAAFRPGSPRERPCFGRGGRRRPAGDRSAPRGRSSTSRRRRRGGERTTKWQPGRTRYLLGYAYSLKIVA